MEQGADVLESALRLLPDPDATPPQTKAKWRLTNLKLQRQTLRRVIGWVEAELQSKSTKRVKRKVTKRQARKRK